MTVLSDNTFFSSSFFFDDNVDDEAFFNDEFSSNNTDAKGAFKCKKKQYDKNCKTKKLKSSATERQKQFIKNKKETQKTLVKKENKECICLMKRWVCDRDECSNNKVSEHCWASYESSIHFSLNQQVLKV